MAGHLYELNILYLEHLQAGGLGLKHVIFKSDWTEDQCHAHLVETFPQLAGVSYQVCKRGRGNGGNLIPIAKDGLTLSYLSVSGK